MGIGRLSDGLAPKPPMGWNSWNRFGVKIDEALVLETAEAMVTSGLRDAGYRYVVIDDGWMASERDRNGNFVADPEKFPAGMKELADRIHSLGLRFGIYTDAGTKTCQDLPASLGYEFRDARRFAEWGVDYVKVDWCHTDGMGPRALYAKWAMALRATGRPIVLSICEWGRARPWEWAGELGISGARAGTFSPNGRASSRSSIVRPSSIPSLDRITGTTRTCLKSVTAS